MALGLAVTLSVFIFISFAFYRGFISFGNDNAISKNQAANVISAKSVPSPIQNSKETFTTAFDEIGKQYQKFKDSMSAVFVPFITSIEVYERK